jgi:hypothetical protein
MSEVKMAVSPHADEAKVVLDKIRALRSEIPRLTTEGLAADGRRLTARARVSDDVLEAISVQLESNPELEQVVRTDATTLRDSYGYAIAYEPVVQELLALAAILTNTIRTQRAKAGAAALTTYAITTRLSKDEGGEKLVPHVKDMRNKLHKKRARKASSDPVKPAPVPVPPAAPVK